MDITDFFIGVFLMNAMPHYILGVWKQRMLSAFGFSNLGNRVYGLINFAISIGLFIFKYGWTGFHENGIYTGAVTILIAFFVLSNLWKKLFAKKHPNSDQNH